MIRAGVTRAAAGVRIGTADTLFSASFSLYYVGKSTADYEGDYDYCNNFTANSAALWRGLLF